MAYDTGLRGQASRTMVFRAVPGTVDTDRDTDECMCSRDGRSLGKNI